jgi:hypothetical protein
MKKSIKIFGYKCKFASKNSNVLTYICDGPIYIVLQINTQNNIYNIQVNSRTIHKAQGLTLEEAENNIIKEIRQLASRTFKFARDLKRNASTVECVDNQNI